MLASRTLLVTLLVACGMPARAPCQGSVPDSVRSALATALQLEGGRAPVVRSLPMSRIFTQTMVFVGHRGPPFGVGLEDSTPSVVTAVMANGAMRIVRSVDDLPEIWQRIGPDSPDPAQATRSVIELLRMTSMPRDARVLHSRVEAKHLIRRAGLVTPQALDQVQSPAASEQNGELVVRVFVDRPIGLFRYDFHLTGARTMRITFERTSDYLMHM